MIEDLLNLASQILLNFKLEQNTQDLENQLAQLSHTQLEAALRFDAQKKTFWINIYNAYYQILRQNGYNKPEIYRKRLFKIAGYSYSLDDVEHGILRKYRYKYSLGFFPNLFSKSRIKKLAVDTIDYRIHFALNCGAVSCPPIAFYDVDHLDSQLDLATQSFLESETIYNHDNKIVKVTALFKWFYGDFGSSQGIREIYKSQLNIDLKDYKLKYRDYSWEDDLRNFV